MQVAFGLSSLGHESDWVCLPEKSDHPVKTSKEKVTTSNFAMHSTHAELAPEKKRYFLDLCQLAKSFESRYTCDASKMNGKNFNLDSNTSSIAYPLAQIRYAMRARNMPSSTKSISTDTPSPPSNLLQHAVSVTLATHQRIHPVSL